MQASLVNLYKKLISKNFLVFVDVQNFLQNTCSLEYLEDRDRFFRFYRGDVAGKRGYVWIDCESFERAFEMIDRHACFLYKIRLESFADDDAIEENLKTICEAASDSGLVAFVEENFVVFPIDSRHLNEETALAFASYSARQPVACFLCEKTAKNQRGIVRHYNLYHSSKLRVEKQR
jgi:hypothetical protein